MLKNPKVIPSLPTKRYKNQLLNPIFLIKIEKNYINKQTFWFSEGKVGMNDRYIQKWMKQKKKGGLEKEKPQYH